MKTKSLYFIGLLGLCLVFACKHEPKGNITTTPPITNPVDTTVDSGMPCSADTAYFVNEIMPILISGCTMSGCHDVASHADGVILTSYDYIMQTAGIKPGSGSKSDLYEAITEDKSDKIMPRPPYSPLTAAQIIKIKLWIDQGAKNNYCDACDTTSEIKYSTHIAPIIQLNCTGCHSTNNAGGGYDLTNYQNLLVIVNNSKLEGVINHSNGYSAMPKNAGKLSICNITKINKWIQGGALNN